MLETKDLLLRKGVLEDWKAMYENLWQHSESARYMLWQISTTPEEAKARMERTIAFQSAHPGLFTVVEKESGQAIGFAGVEPIASGVWEDAGIAIGPKFTGRGYGKQIVHALTEYVFGPLQGERFVYSARSQNAVSIALARSCGFEYTHCESRTDPRNGVEYTLNFYEKRRSP